MSEDYNRVIDNGIFRQDRDGIHYYDQSEDRNQEDLDLNDPDEYELNQTLCDVSTFWFFIFFDQMNEKDQIHFLRIQVSELRKTLLYE